MIKPALTLAGLAIAAGQAFAQAAGGSASPPHQPSAVRPAAPNSQTAGRDLRLARAEALLAQGKAQPARDAFEQAAALEHAADIELGILRSQMQAGQYQQALDFAAHTAGAHQDEAAGAAFYAWLLHLGGQQAIAQKTLDEAETRMPGDAALARVRSLLKGEPASDPAVPAFERLAPYAIGEPVPPDARVIGSAVLLKGGKLAISSLESLAEGGKLWLRNGLGKTVRATVKRKDAALGLALLALAKPLDEPATVIAPQEAFPGSPAYVFGYVPGSAKDGAWPRTSIGFLGRARDAASGRPLGIDLPAGTQGAPVIDQKGNLAGIVLPPGPDGLPRLSGVAALRALAGEPSAAAQPASMRVLADLYEQAMRMSLEVIAAKPGAGEVPRESRGGAGHRPR